MQSNTEITPFLDTVTCSDSLEFLQRLPDGCIELILTDPPYNFRRDLSWDRWGSADSFLEWLDAHIAEFRRVIKPKGSFYLYCSTKYAGKVESVVERYFTVLNVIRWFKPPFNTKAEITDKKAMRTYFPASESIIFAEPFCEGYADPEYDLHAVYAPLKAWFRERAQQAGISIKRINQVLGVATSGSGLGGYYIGKKVEFILPTEDRYNQLQAAFPGVFDRPYTDLRAEYDALKAEYERRRRPFEITEDRPYVDVWTYETVNTYKGKHPCEKPLDMLENMILTSSRKGDVVLDCFAGSGSTLEAAKRLGRSFIGCDNDPYWVERAKERCGLNDAT